MFKQQQNDGETEIKYLYFSSQKSVPVVLPIIQANYKAAYDLAFQAKVMQMNFTEVKFKFGTDEEPVYHIFTSFEEFADFYVSAVNYIQACYQSGWTEKDELEKLSDNELRTLYSEEV